MATRFIRIDDCGDCLHCANEYEDGFPFDTDAIKIYVCWQNPKMITADKQKPIVLDNYPHIPETCRLDKWKKKWKYLSQNGGRE